MTAEQAIFLLCEEYDAPFKDSSGNVKLTIKYRIDWIKKNIPEEHIEHFTKKLMLNVQSQYLKAGRLPGLDVFESMIKPSSEELETEASQMFDKLMSSVNIYRDFITDNPRLMSALIRLGGWKAVCHSDVESVPYMRKDFIREYVKCNPDMVSLEPSYGIGTNGKKVFIGTDRNAVQIEHTPDTKWLNRIANLIDADKEYPEKDIDEKVNEIFGEPKTH